MNRALVFITAAALLAACGGRPVRQISAFHELHNAMSQDTLNANMGARGASRQWGSASMGDAKHGLDVVIDIQNEPRGASEPAYIAKSNCTPPSPKAWRALAPVTAGKSKTHIAGADIGQIKKGRYSVVVLDARSRSPVSCGDFEI